MNNYHVGSATPYPSMDRPSHTVTVPAPFVPAQKAPVQQQYQQQYQQHQQQPYQQKYQQHQPQQYQQHQPQQYQQPQNQYQQPQNQYQQPQNQYQQPQQQYQQPQQKYQQPQQTQPQQSQPQPQHQPQHQPQNQPQNQPQRPYPVAVAPGAPYPAYMTQQRNVSTDSITTRLQNSHIQERKGSAGNAPFAQNPAAMGSSLSFQSSLDEQQQRQGSVSSNHSSTPSQTKPPAKSMAPPPFELTHHSFTTVRERAMMDNAFTPSIQLAFVKALLEASADDSFLLRYDTTGAEWDHMLSNSEVKKNQHAFIKQGIKLLKKLANDVNDPESQFILACLYSHSPMIKVPKKDLLEKNYEKACNLYARAGSKGHAMALYRLAVVYELGVGTSADPKKAIDCFEKSANQGCVAAKFRLGMIYSRGALDAPRSAQKSMYWLHEAAKGASKEDPHALFELAKVYERDLGLTDSPSDQAFAQELDQLGDVYDESKALFYYKEAARHVYPPAQFKLGWCYEYGRLQCPIDAKKSIGWYSRAAKQGHSPAEMALSGWYLTGAKGILPSNDREAYLWASKAAQNGFVKADYALGYYHEVGLGCEKDMEVAKKYYLRAATQGHEKSIARLKQLREQR